MKNHNTFNSIILSTLNQSKIMKKLILSTILSLATIALFAQVKIGANPTLITANAKLQVEGSTGNKVTVMDNGNVGIGTTAPTQLLQVTGSNTSGDVLLGLFQNSIGSTNPSGTSATIRLAPTSSPTARGVDLTAEQMGFNNIDFVIKNSASSFPIERMRIQSNGNVGIGTVSPGGLLDVRANAASALARNIFRNDGATSRQDLQIGATGAGDLYLGVDAIGGLFGAGVKAYIDNRTSGRMGFGSNGNEQISLLTNGNFGIGTTNPKSCVHILCEPTATSNITTSYVKGITLTGKGGAGYTGPGFYLENTDNPAGKKLFKINYTADGGSEGYVNFQSVSDDAGSSVVAGIMAITHSGKVGIGTTAPTANLHVNGTTLAAAWSTSSDARLKTNIAGLSQGTLDKVMQLQAVSYDKKESLESTKYNKKEIGFIAQDLQKVFPTLVQENGKDKLLSVNYSELIPVLTKAIQEQQAQIEALKKENAGLKVETAKVEALESQMSALNAKMELFLKVAQPSSVMGAK
jgi:Chaperone of endosialidase